MFLRAIVLLSATIALSLAATFYFGNEVLIALGMILAQLKVVTKKLAGFELPAILVWLKAQAAIFFRIELLKKWFLTTVAPLILGKAILRRFAAFIGSYRKAVRQRYDALLAWYAKLHWVEKSLAALIVLFAIIALSVTSLGLWLVIFSVKLPLWVAAASAALWRMVWLSSQKMAFKAVAFLQLKWLWRVLRRILPSAWLDRKRKFDYRMARAIIRRRRMAVRRLAKSTANWVKLWTSARR